MLLYVYSVAIAGQCLALTVNSYRQSVIGIDC